MNFTTRPTEPRSTVLTEAEEAMVVAFRRHTLLPLDDWLYDANRLRATLREQGTIPIIPGRRYRKRPIQYDERRYKDRWRVEAMFCRRKDFMRIATRYDKLARNFLSAISLVAAIAFWV